MKEKRKGLPWWKQPYYGERGTTWGYQVALLLGFISCIFLMWIIFSLGGWPKQPDNVICGLQGKYLICVTPILTKDSR